MKHFLKYFNLRNLFFRGRQDDRIYFAECVKMYSRIGNVDNMKQFLEDYAIAMTQRETMLHLKSPKEYVPPYHTYQEIKKLLDFIDNLEKNFWQKAEKTIG